MNTNALHYSQYPRRSTIKEIGAAIINSLTTLPKEREVIAKAATKSVLRSEIRSDFKNLSIVDAEVSDEFGLVNGIPRYDAVAILSPENTDGLTPLSKSTSVVAQEMGEFLDNIVTVRSLGEELKAVLPEKSL